MRSNRSLFTVYCLLNFEHDADVDRDREQTGGDRNGQGCLFGRSTAHTPAHIERDREPAVAADADDLAQLDFGYVVRFAGKGRSPDWTPRRVFTDGRKTYIGFPENLDVMEAPPLFLLPSEGTKGDAKLVNYRVRGNYYIVDQVIRRAELRLGQAPQQVVTIERIGDARDVGATRAGASRLNYRR